MKRCPQCLFIYPESDQLCDFDNTPLVAIDEAELPAANAPVVAPSPPRSRPVWMFVAPFALIIGLILIGVVYGLTRRTQATATIQPVAETPLAPAPVLQPALATPSPSPSPTTKPTPEREVTAHSVTTGVPISTSGPGMGKKAGSKPAILLTNGTRIEADEVWRTGDGFWYRRGGIVTLVKANRVKAIVNQ